MKIVFWNCSRTGNFGDDLVHEGAVEWARRTFGVFESKQIFKLNEHNRDEIGTYDLLIIGGGQILDRSDFIDRLLRFNPGIPYIFLGVGIGSVADIAPYAGRLKPLEWYVRDERSLEILRECGLDGINIRDVSFFAMNQIVLKDFSRRMPTLCLRNVHKNEGFAGKLSELLDNFGEEVALISHSTTARHQRIMDGEMCEISDCDGGSLVERIVQFSKVPEKRTKILYNGLVDDPIEFAGNYGIADYMVCERFHSVVMAYQFGIPFRAIVYHDKTARFLSDVGMADVIIGPEPQDIVEALMEMRGRRA